jgi:hypothetical protein
MANDVFNDAARRPPDPGPNDTNNNNTQEVAEDKEMTITEELPKPNDNLIIKKSYVSSSTRNYSTANPNNINNRNADSNNVSLLNKPSGSVVNDPNLSTCSNTIGQRASIPSTGAISHRQPSNTQLTTSTYETPLTPSTPYTSNTSTLVSFHTPQNMDISIEASDNVPPIEPFVLGRSPHQSSPFRRKSPTNGPLDMRSLQTATRNASNETNIPVLPTTTNDEDSSHSLSPMDTADVSTSKPKLLPKTSLNPYSKHGITKPADQSVLDQSNSDSRRYTHQSNVHFSPNTEINDTNVLSTNNSHQDTVQPGQSIEFQELSQDDLKLVNQAISEQEEKNKWIEVPHKSPRRTYSPDRTDLKPNQNNPYGPLQSDDEETQATNTSSIEIDNDKLQNETKDVTSKTTTRSIVQTPTSLRPTISKNKSSIDRNKSTAGRGGGKITRDSQTNLTTSLTQIATATTTPEIGKPPTNTADMDIDTPPSNSTSASNPKPPSYPNPSSNLKPPPNFTQRGSNSTSLNRAVNQPLKYTFKKYFYVLIQTKKIPKTLRDSTSSIQCC